MQYVILATLTFIKVLVTTLKSKARVYELDEWANILGSIMDGMNILITSIAVTNCSNNQELTFRILTVIITGYLAGKVAVKIFEILLNKFKGDDRWIYFIIAKSKSYGKEIADTLRMKDIEVYTLDGYYHKESSLFSIVISNSKEDSVKIKEICNKDKCKRIKI